MSVFYGDYLHVYFWCFITSCNWCCRSFFKIQVINSVLSFFFHRLSLTYQFQHCVIFFRTGNIFLKSKPEILAKLLCAGVIWCCSQS